MSQLCDERCLSEVGRRFIKNISYMGCYGMVPQEFQCMLMTHTVAKNCYTCSLGIALLQTENIT